MMNKYIQVVKTYVTARSSKELYIGVAVIGVAAALIVVLLSLIFNNTPKIVYQPAHACALLTTAEASELLGTKTMKSSSSEPKQSGDTAVSRCGYTDGNSNSEAMTVAAIIVRSGVNDKGVAQNKSEFSAGRPSKNVEMVTGLGDSAYFNRDLGQLNLLDGRNWIVVSYGPGSTPQDNTVDDAVSLAHKVVR